MFVYHISDTAGSTNGWVGINQPSELHSAQGANGQQPPPSGNELPPYQITKASSVCTSKGCVKYGKNIT